jgi:hypothetical protein
MVLEEGGGQGFCDNGSRAFLIKSVTVGGGEVKNGQICVTSFTDDCYYDCKLQNLISFSFRKLIFLISQNA